MAPRPPRAADDDAESADTHTLLRVHSASSSFRPTRPALNGLSAAEADGEEDEDAPAPMVLMRRPTLVLGAASATMTGSGRDGNEATKAVRRRVDTSRMQRANEVICWWRW